MADKPNIPSGNSHKIIHYVPAIILFPALLTPAVLTGNDDLEILLLGKSGQPIEKVNIAHQLKISELFHPSKIYRNSPLPLDCIHIEDKKMGIGDEILQTKGGTFKGMLDKRALKILFSDKAASIDLQKNSDLLLLGPYTKVYSVRINNRGFFKPQVKKPNRGIYDLIWVHRKYMDFNVIMQALTGARKKKTPPASHSSYNAWSASGKNSRLLPGELQSKLFQKTLDEMATESNDSPWWKYAFVDGIPSKKNFDGKNPIQAYHPVFYFENLKCANIGHLADVHVCARQHLMCKSKARVIHYEKGKSVLGDTDISPEIGGMVNVNLENLKNILSQIGKDPNIHMIAISGDLIDYVQSLYVENHNKNWSIREIWNTMGLNDKYEKNYKDGVDFISLYSILVKFYIDHKKPVFVVTGNHDCYSQPYGISPRVKVGIELKRANEGIAADHNLTLYEAILSFGKTYGIYKDRLKAPKLKWFHTIFTPFSDFALHLPNQCLVGLGWGDNEDVLGLPSDSGQGFWGHLPRSDDAISKKQRSFFENVQKNKGNRKVILMSHFTFVSYDDAIPMYPQHKGKVNLVIVPDRMDFGDYDMGTFEKNRLRFYGFHLAKRRDKDVQCILTGHSHRKGLYTIDGVGSNFVKTSFYELHQFPTIDPLKRYPAIIVSDSAGPVPRFNKLGELFGWGSDRPSGTKLEFNDDGSIRSITPIRSWRKTAKPRFVVALDYMDIIKGKKVIRQFQCDPFEISQVTSGKKASYNFRLELHPHVEDLVYVNGIILYGKRIGKSEWYKLEMSYDKGTNRWKINDVKFRERFASGASKTFLAMRFSKKPDRSDRLAQYDFGSYWCFEVKIKPKFSLSLWTPPPMYYEIKRDKGSAEIPDFDWRKNEFPNEYT